jgi:hypothetical protein
MGKVQLEERTNPFRHFGLRCQVYTLIAGMTERNQTLATFRLREQEFTQTAFMKVRTNASSELFTPLSSLVQSSLVDFRFFRASTAEEKLGSIETAIS